MAILELKQVYYSYKNRYQQVDAIKGISLNFEKGKVYSIVGPSGSGKTTLLSLIAGLDKPTSGAIYYQGQNIEHMDKDYYRRKCISFIYQSFNLLPFLTVLENVLYPMKLNKMDMKEAKEKAIHYLKSLGIKESQHNRFPSTLSGGEQQRVAIARALAANPKVLLADEPTGNLDSDNSKNIVNILRKLSHENNYCVIVVTHDLEVAEKADEVIKLKDGEIIYGN